MKRLFTLILALVTYSTLMAEEPMHPYATPTERHYLEIFRPNYFTTGIPLDRTISDATSDIKFQVSVRANVWRNIGGSEFSCFVGYTQTSLWNIYEHSSPFYDNTYNPGLYFERTFSRNDNPFGNLLFGFEHKSNGRADAMSRSVNYLFASYTHLLPAGFALQGKAWFGQGYVEDTNGFTMTIWDISTLPQCGLRTTVDSRRR